MVGDCGADAPGLRRGLRAVERGGWGELTRWPGSHLVVACREATVAVIGDLVGLHPVYWRTTPLGIWWSSSAWALASLDGSAQVDARELALRLAVATPGIPGATGSLFAGVSRVPSGSLLLLEDNRARVVGYEPREYDPVPLARAAPQLRHALTAAVDSRLDGRPVSADLAGLDSTALACLAARRGPVTAVTFADARLRDDDLVHARGTAAVVPALAHHVVPGGRDTVYYADLHAPEALPRTDAPHAYVATMGIKRAVLDVVVAAAGGGGVRLTGSAGDGVVWAGPSYLADLLRERRFPTLLRHVFGHARLRCRPPVELLGQHLRAGSSGLVRSWRQAAADLSGPARPWMPQARRPVSWTPLLDVADWMPAPVRQDVAAALRTAVEFKRHVPARRIASWHTSHQLADVATDLLGWDALTRHWHGVDLASPYLDDEVVRICLAVPAEQRGAPDRYKPLLTQAFAGTGVLPRAVLERTTKGGFEGVAYAGLRTHAPILRELLGTGSRLAALGLLTPAPIHEVLDRAVAGRTAALGALHQCVAAEVWLRQVHHDTTTRTTKWWEDNDVATA
ncbi:hypothetical protein GCM10010428_81200 [Actinosynnema pretiosum subsp. pretiosum]